MRVSGLVSALAPPLCWSCGASAPAPEPLCRTCRGALRWMGSETVVLGGVEAWAPVGYEGPARAVVRALKFRGASGLAEAMAAQMAAGAPAHLLAGAVLVPVPLHPRRLQRRGFNQAERIARALARRTGLSIRDCLERRGSSAPQMGRSRAERVEAMRGAVAPRQHAEAPCRALLIDDVATTGATVAACAAALRAAGARELGALAYARTPAR